VTTRSLLRSLTLAGVAFALSACADSMPTSPLSTDAAVATAAGGGTTLFFNGANANTSTPLGTVLTTQIDNIAVEATVRYDGANAANGHQMIYYNGHGAVSGWGIIVIDGMIGILAGGIDIPMTPFTITDGTWHHVYAERRDQQVTVVFDGETFVIGGLGVNPVGGFFAGIERTSVGGDGTFDAPTGDFNGAIDNVKVRDLNTDQWIERWNFNAGSGTTATGVNGNVLQIGNAVWARRGQGGP
jgi:hypothetical protein